MKTKEEIKEMKEFFEQETKRLEAKCYVGMPTYIRDEAVAHILAWVLEGED